MIQINPSQYIKHVVITHFLVLSNYIFFSSKKKKHQNNVVLNGTFLLFPCPCRGREEEDFKSFPAILPICLALLTCPKTQATSHTLPPLIQAMTSHPTLCQDMGRVATLPCAMAVVRCPSLPAAINTKKGEDKKEEGRFWKERRRRRFEKQGGVCFKTGEEHSLVAIVFLPTANRCHSPSPPPPALLTPLSFFLSLSPPSFPCCNTR